MDILELYEKYITNVNKIEELDSIEKTTASCDVWVKSMEKRAQMLYDAYQNNNAILNQITKYCNSDLNNNELNELFVILNKLFIKSADSELLKPIVERLSKYFDSIKDYNKAITVSLIGFMIVDQKAQCENDTVNSRMYLENIVDYSKYYDELDEVSKRKVFIAYHALSTSYIEHVKESNNLSYKWFKELLSFYEKHNDINDSLDLEWKKEYIRFAKIDWLSISKAYYDLCDDAKRDIYILALHQYTEEYNRVNGNIYDILPQVYSGYLNVMAGTGELSYEDVADKLFDYYQFNINRIDKCREKDNIILNIPIEILGHLKHLADRKKAIEIFNVLDKIVQSSWKKYFTKRTSNYVNNLFSCWVTNALYFIDDKEIQQKYILTLLVKKQIPIYLHTIMVKNIAEVIYSNLAEKKPELFNNIHEDNMETYINNAALLHDIGKIKISTIINQHDRRLSDGEYMGIRKHPSYGAELISDSKGLQKYTDVILYHHKYYDGNGGYPLDNGNTKSKYRIIIDIITISDSLEAATDYLGRNYRGYKTADEVFEEFLYFKGTKYNPEIVDFILNDAKLKQEIKKITGDYRKELMYKAYKNGVEGLN